MTPNEGIEMSDDELVDRIKRRDPSGLLALQREHGPSMLRIISFYLMGFDADAAYVNSQFEIRNTIDRWRPDEQTLRTWCCSIAMAQARKLRRQLWKRQGWEKPLEHDPSEEEDDHEPQPFPELLKWSRELADLYEIILGLPPLQRAVALADLADPPDANVDELAEVLQTTPQSIRSARNKYRGTVRSEMSISDRL